MIDRQATYNEPGFSSFCICCGQFLIFEPVESKKEDECRTPDQCRNEAILAERVGCLMCKPSLWRKHKEKD